MIDVMSIVKRQKYLQYKNMQYYLFDYLSTVHQPSAGDQALSSYIS
jgi:hypothetical protein